MLFKSFKKNCENFKKFQNFFWVSLVVRMVRGQGTPGFFQISPLIIRLSCKSAQTYKTR